MKAGLFLALLFGVALADNHACNTKERADKVNAAVGRVVAAIMPQITAVAGNVNMQVIQGVMEQVCTNETDITTIDLELKGCPALIANITQLAALKLNISTGVGTPAIPFDFGELLLSFPEGAGQFCDCRAFLPTAWQFKFMLPMLRRKLTGASYPDVLDVEMLCNNTMIRTSIDTIFNNTKTCAVLPQQAGSKMDDIVHMKGFLLAKCSTATKENFNCTVTELEGMKLTDCISKANTLTGDKINCEKEKCVDGNIGTKCGVNAAGNFKYIVKMECSLAPSNQASILLLLAAMVAFLSF